MTKVTNARESEGATTDLNQNGIQDAGEPGIAGAVVSLNGVSIQTDVNGFYSFALTD